MEVIGREGISLPYAAKLYVVLTIAGYVMELYNLLTKSGFIPLYYANALNPCKRICQFFPSPNCTTSHHTSAPRTRPSYGRNSD